MRRPFLFRRLCPPPLRHPANDAGDVPAMRGCGTRFRGEYAVSIDTIKAGLEASIDALVAKLLPGAIQDGDEWMIGSVAGEAGRSMAINRKARAGIWKDFAADMKGDALDLVAAVLFRGDKTEAIKWSKSWLGLDGQDPERIKQFRLRAEETATKNKDRKSVV